MRNTPPMHHRYLLLALLVPTLSTAQPIPWTWLNPEPIGEHVSGLDMIDAQTGWALAYGGYLLKTTDGGASWQVHDTGMLWRQSRGLQFTSADTGWATVQNGLLRTTDGGLSWNTLNTGLVLNPNILPGMHFTDHLHGWLVYNDGVVQATFDGGTTWNPQVSTTTENLIDVHFTDALTGCAVGTHGTILRTADGGGTWTLVNSGTTSALLRVTFSDPLNVWAIATIDSFAFHSADAGLTWAPVEIGHDFYAYDMYFRTPQEGWLLSGKADEGMYHTADGGQSWSPVGTGTVEVMALEYTDALHAVGGGDCASLGYTTDGGANWTNVHNGPSDTWTNVQFLDALNGYAAAKSTVVRTTDGGDTWVELPAPDQLDGSLHFIDPLEGWIGGWVGQTCHVYHTLDGGQSWDTLVLPTQTSIYDLWFTDPLHGWAASDFYGSISRTTDGGANWTSYDPPGGPATITGVQFVDTLHGWMIGAGDQRYWSDDGGITWNPSFTWGQHVMRDLAFRDSLVGVVCGDTTILYTTDGGVTWSNAQMDPLSSENGTLTTLAWTAPDEVWCAGVLGNVLRSTDAGLSWVELERHRVMIFSLAWSGQALYAAGACGALLRLDDLSVAVADAPPPQHPGALYPNPNDGRSFHLPVSTCGHTAQLRVFDSSGRLQVQQRVSSNGPTGIALAKALVPGAYTVVLTHANGGAQRWHMVVAE